MEVAALVLGIVALVGGLLGPLGWIGSICAILGIIFGVLGMKKESEKKGMAKAGLIMSIIALVLSIIITVACLACTAAIVNEAANELGTVDWDELSSALESLNY